MRKLPVVASILSALLLTAAAPAPPCAACSCMRDPNQPLADAVPQAYGAARAVFTGLVIRAHYVTSREALAGADPYSVRYDVVVDRSWKGPPARDTVVVTSAGNVAMCGADLWRGRKYLFYADSSAPEGLTAFGCSRTARLSSVQPEELRLLGRLRSSRPAAPGQVPPSDRNRTPQTDSVGSAAPR